MLGEGMLVNNTDSKIKTIMVDELAKLGSTDPKTWEGAVFKALTGHDRDEIDWDFEDNKVGYYQWVRTFDKMIQELVDDGYVKATKTATGQAVLKPGEPDPGIQYSFAGDV